MPSKPTPDYATRYRAGEHEEVWRELLALGDAVRDPAVLPEAMEVVRETMLRVRGNIEIIIAALRENGFEFGVYPDGEALAETAPLIDPDPELDRKLIELERLLGGPIPLSLLGFWKWVGTVELVGRHPDWIDYSDPLWSTTIDYAIDEYPEHVWRNQQQGKNKPFALELAPDLLQKDNVSGGPALEMVLPNAAIDATVSDDDHDDWLFIDYLRDSIAWGGFPGFQQDPEVMPDWLRETIERLRPF